MAMMIKPKRLINGAKIAFVAPSSTPDRQRLEKGARFFKDLGYSVKIYPQVRKSRRFLAGTDDARADALMEAFSDKDIDAVFCARGGYGALRILSLLDFEIISQNPKIFLGFSDITVLHLALFKKSNLTTFHGPMPAIDFGGAYRKFTCNYLEKAIMSKNPVGIVEVSENIRINKLSSGKATGNIIGGNLSLICKLVGSGYLPSFKNRILFIEDVGENAEKVDGYLAQLFLSTDIEMAKGIIVGEFSNSSYSGKNAEGWIVDDVIKDYFGNSKIPVISNFPCGHGKDKITIPMGVNVLLDADRKLLDIKEAGVI